MKVTSQSFDGAAGTEVELNDEVFGLDPRADILHRVVTWQLEKRRATASGTRERADVARTGKKFGRLTRPLVRFGKPLDFSRYEGMEKDRYILRSVTDEIMYEIMRLSGQEYVDTYASKAKELAAKAKAGCPVSKLLKAEISLDASLA